MKRKVLTKKHIITAFITSLLLSAALYAGFSKPREAEAGFTVSVSESGATITSSDVKKDQLTPGRNGFVTVGFTVSVGTPEAYHGGGPGIYYDNTSFASRYFNTNTSHNDWTDWSDVPSGTTYTTTYKMDKIYLDAVLSSAGFTWDQFNNGECSLVFDAIIVDTENRRDSSPPYNVNSYICDWDWLGRPPINNLSTAHYRTRNQNKYHNGIPALISWGDEEDHFEIVVTNGTIAPPEPGEGPIKTVGQFPIRFGSDLVEPRPWDTPSGANPLIMKAKPDLLATYNWDTEDYYHVGNIPSNDISTDGIPSSGNNIKTSIHNGVVASSWTGSTGARYHNNAIDGTNDSYAFLIPCKFNYIQYIYEEVEPAKNGHSAKYEWVPYSFPFSETAGFTLFLTYDYMEVGEFDFYDIYGIEVRIQDESKTEQLYPQYIEYYSLPQSIRLVTNKTADNKTIIAEINKLLGLEASTPTFKGKYKGDDYTGPYYAPDKPKVNEVVKTARQWFYDTYIFDDLQPSVFYTTDATIRIDGVDHLETTQHNINTKGGYLKDGTVQSGYASVHVETPGFIHSRPNGRPKTNKVEPEKIRGINKCSENEIRQNAKNGPYWCQINAAYVSDGTGKPEQNASTSQTPANVLGSLDTQRPFNSVVFTIEDTRGKVDAILQKWYYTTLEELNATIEDAKLDIKGFKTPPLVSPQQPGKTYTYVQDEPIIIHTPVIVNVNITNPENKTQLLSVNKSSSESAGNYDEIKTYVNDNELRLDEWYSMQFNHEQHKNSPGYYGADDRIIKDEFVQKKTFTFPYDVVYKNKVVKAGTEQEIDKGDWKKFDFYIPAWSDTGLYGVAGKGDHILLKVYATNSMRGTRGEGDEENKHNEHSPDEESTYIATYYIACQVSGWIYDFKATGINASYLYNTDEYLDDENPHKPTALCPIKREKRTGQFNRKGTDLVRFEEDGSVTNQWSERNTLPFRRGVSNNSSGLGNLVRGNWFTFSLKTIDNLTSETDFVDITPTYRLYSKSGTLKGAQGTDFQIYYWKQSADGTLHLIEYGSPQDVMSETYLAEPTFTSAKSNYAWKLPSGYWENNHYKTTFAYRRAQGMPQTTVNEMVETKVNCYSLSKIRLTKDLKLYTGNKGQLYEYFDQGFAGNPKMTNTSSSGIFPKYLSASYYDEFNQSMQTWYGKYFIPSTLVVIDLKELKNEGYNTIEEFVMDNNGIDGTEDFFVNDGYLMVNFDIKTSDEDEPENNLGYVSNDGGDCVWSREQKGDPNPDPPGDPKPTPGNRPGNPPKDIPPRKPGDEDDPPEAPRPGDVGVIELEPTMDVKNQYYVGLWGIN